MAPWWLRASDDEAPLEDEVDSPKEKETTASGGESARGSTTESTKARPEPGAPSWKSRTTGDDEPAAKKPEHEESTSKEAPAQDTPSEESPREAPKRRRRRRRRRRSSSTPRPDGQAKGAPAETSAAADPDESKKTSNRPTEPEQEPAPRQEAAADQRTKGRMQASAKTQEAESAPETEVEQPEDRKPEPKKEKAEPSEPAAEDSPILPVIAALDRNVTLPLLPDRPMSQDERKIAVFCDFENIALGVRDSEVKKLDINLVLARLLEKGKIIVKKAYADWERYSDYKRPFHEAAIELIDIPQKYYSGKNSADIKLVVDAMDLCYSKEHLDTFVIVSGDSDFSPLVSKLKENNKYVIGIGVKNASSSLLIDNCDEFIYYEDVWRSAQQKPRLDNLQPKEAEVFGLMADAMLALIRENKEVLWGSMIKQTMQRKRPSFNEATYGYATFSELLEDAERKNIIGVRKDQRSGNYVVTGFVPNR